MPAAARAYPYLLRVTPGVPDFELLIDTDKTWVTPGTCAPIFVRARRINGFDGPIDLQDRRAAGRRHRPLRADSAGERAGRLHHSRSGGRCGDERGERDRSPARSRTRTAYRSRGRRRRSRRRTCRGAGGTMCRSRCTPSASVAAPTSATFRSSTYDLRLKPGESKRIDVTLTRSEGFAQNVTLDVLFQHLGSVYGNPLPAGVSLDAKNSTTLLSGGESKGYVTLIADASAKPVESQQCCLMANVSINFVMKATYCEPPAADQRRRAVGRALQGTQMTQIDEICADGSVSLSCSPAFSADQGLSRKF